MTKQDSVVAVYSTHTQADHDIIAESTTYDGLAAIFVNLR